MMKFNRRLAQQEPLKSILTGETLKSFSSDTRTDMIYKGVELNPGLACQTDEQIAGVSNSHRSYDVFIIDFKFRLP